MNSNQELSRVLHCDSNISRADVLENVTRLVEASRHLSDDGIPPILKERNVLGWLPIHSACRRHGGFLELIQYLVNQYPESVKEKRDEMLPLHYACCGDPSLEVVQFLVNQYPESVKEKRDEEMLPLHDACCGDRSLEVVQFLVNQYPESVEARDRLGRLPIHFACEFSGALDVVKYLTEKYPESVKKKTFNGILPLDLCFTEYGRFDVMKYLALEYPDGVMIAKLPQWVISPENAPSEVVKSCHYGDGGVLWKAIARAAPLSAIKSYVDKHPESPKEKHAEEFFYGKKLSGMLPLHFALERKSPLDVCKYLVTKYPNGVTDKDDHGNFPLHWACRYRESFSKDLVQYLVDQYPESVQGSDRTGRLPLHVACEYSTTLEVIKILVGKYPEGVNEMTVDFKKPLDMVQKGTPVASYLLNTSYLLAASERNQMLRGDHSTGEDLLGVGEVTDALGDNLAFKDLEPPFVVAISGGWGTGKTFTFNLIKERLKWIQSLPVPEQKVDRDSFPYAGHIYLVNFSAWTYAKGDLWSSLMYRILSDLNDQLFLESKIPERSLLEGMSIIESIENITDGEYKYLGNKLKDEKFLTEIKEWSPQSGNVTPALINAVGKGYEADLKKMNELKKEEYNLALEVVAGEAKILYGEVFYDLFKEALKQHSENEEISLLIETGIISPLSWWRIVFAEKMTCLSCVGIVLLIGLILFAVLANLYLDSIVNIISVVAPVIVGTTGVAMRIWKFYSRIHNVAQKFDEVRKGEVSLGEDEWRIDVEAQEKEPLNKKRAKLAVVKREIAAIHSEVHLVEGESLASVVRKRVEAGDYENELGVVHRAQKDLQQLSYALLSRRNGHSIEENTVTQHGRTEVPGERDEKDHEDVGEDEAASGNDPDKEGEGDIEQKKGMDGKVRDDVDGVDVDVFSSGAGARLPTQVNDTMNEDEEVHSTGSDRDEDSEATSSFRNIVNYLRFYLCLALHRRRSSCNNILKWMRSGNKRSMSEKGENRDELVQKEQPFPRGDPRIVLFVDDLDRCPPRTVVEMLEAIQLLVKTKLFVVVLALDSRYVTLSLEENYRGILRRDGSPSGMDYLEKIVQLPYRIPPPDDTVMREYIRVQMGSEETRKSPSGDNDGTGLDEGQKRRETPKDKNHDNMQERFKEVQVTDAATSTDNETFKNRGQIGNSVEKKNKEELKSNKREESRQPRAPQRFMPTVKLTTDENEFKSELDTLTETCVAADVTPRATKRLVNVFKLMKMVWHSRDKRDGAGAEEVKEKNKSVRLACLVLLALSTSRLPGMRGGMQEVFTDIQKQIRESSYLDKETENETQTSDKSVAGLIMPILKRHCQYSYSCSSIVTKHLSKVTPSDLSRDLRLVRSFSFLGEEWSGQTLRKNDGDKGNLMVLQPMPKADLREMFS